MLRQINTQSHGINWKSKQWQWQSTVSNSATNPTHLGWQRLTELWKCWKYRVRLPKIVMEIGCVNTGTCTHTVRSGAHTLALRQTCTSMWYIRNTGSCLTYPPYRIHGVQWRTELFTNFSSYLACAGFHFTKSDSFDVKCQISVLKKLIELKSKSFCL